mgnify:CR=1 FL=1
MYRYVAGRLAWTVFAAVAVLSAYFALLVLAPDPDAAVFAFRAAARGADPEAAARTYEQLRGGGALPVRYAEFVSNVARGNFGWSFSRNRPVNAAVLDALPYTLGYAVPAAAFAVVAGYAVGLYGAFNRHTGADRLLSGIAFFGVSVPNFWLGIVCILLFAVRAPEVSVLGVELLPLPSYYRTAVVHEHGFLSAANARQLLLPALVVGTGAVAANARYARGEAAEYVRATFVKAARARGANGYRAAYHALRPALVPLITVLLSDLLATFLAGAYVTEVVFQVPGVAMLSYEALRAGDTPLVVATTLLPVLGVLLGNLAQDIAYRVLDPRVEVNA